jgi:aerobic-type carbon monoxide dehydrogenase small subunit (CoxS/CutS family)
MNGTFIINGTKKEIQFDGRLTLLQLLRTNGYEEVKEGCDEGQCGSCVVLLDGALVNSCQVFAATSIGKEITTVKGIGTIHKPNPIQESFVEAGAVQCGFCTPGMVIAAFALIKEKPNPTEEEIKIALDGNLCRCTGYVKIVDGVRLAAERMAK